jgi:hypothetical protein
MRVPADQELAAIYQARCRKEGIVPVRITLTPEEIRLGRIIPVRTEKMKVSFDNQAFAALRREAKDLPAYQLGAAETILRNMVDGKRSILQLRNAAAAEIAGVTLKNVENWVLTLQKLGYVTIVRR